MLTQPPALPATQTPTARSRRRRGIAAALAAACAATTLAVVVPTASAAPIVLDLGPTLDALHARPQVQFTVGQVVTHVPPVGQLIGALSGVIQIKL
jgi:hypothetical protein